MLIKESDIRKLIRRAILAEVTRPRMSAIRTMKEQDCPYYRDMPAKFAKLFNSGTFGEMADTLSQSFPKVASDLGLLGLGSRAGQISHQGMHPNDIAAISSSNNGAQILFGYINSYLYAGGMGCLQFYYLGLGLDFLATLLGADGQSNPSPQPTGPKNVIVEFKKGIQEKSLELANDSAGFINNYPYYALPSLAAKGPEYSESDCVDLLNKDLKTYQDKINNIKNIRAYSISDTYEEIIDELGIGSTKFAAKIDLSKIDRDDPQLSEALKANAVADLIIALGEARLSYNSVISSNPDFKRSFENFLTFNS